MEKIFAKILPSWVVWVSILVFLNTLILLQVPLIGDFASFVYLFLFPGFLLLESMQMKYKDYWKKILHMVALSIAHVLFCGLLVNSILPWFGNIHPLAFESTIIFFNMSLTSIIFFNFFFRKSFIDLSRIFLFFKVFERRYLFPILFPIGAVAGATILNNEGGNDLVFVLIAGIALFIFSLFLTKKDFSESFLQSSLYFIALALLFMTSMRGWHIIGFDVHQEFRIFQLTKDDLFWSMNHMRDAYNACLSITILPTIISQYIHLSDEYIYKFLYPVLYSTLSVALYQFARIFGGKKMAFLAAFFFIVQPWFFFGMPMLNRQAIGSLFFILMMGSLFDETIQKKSGCRIAMIYGAAMAVSHYSTTYIAIALLSFAYGLNSFLALYFRFRKNTFPVRRIPISIIIVLIGVVFVWNTLITHTSDSFAGFLDRSASNMSSIFTGDVIINSVNQLLYPYPLKINLETYLQNYTKEFRNDHPELQFYENSTEQMKQIKPLKFQTVPSRMGDEVRLFFAYFFKFIKILVNNVFILLGVFAMFYYWFKNRFKWNELVFLSVSGFILLASILIIPDALREYNLERLYFQLLIVWSFAGIFGGFFLLSFLRKSRYMYTILSVIYCTLLLYFSGFIFDIVGGPAFIAMNNYGEDYEKNYTHSEEVTSAVWLSRHYDGSLIYTNSVGSNKLQAFGKFNKESLIPNTLPSIINQKSYVYLTYMNTVGSMGTVAYNGDEYAYTYPKEFLEENKDQIYSNGISKIYR